MSRPRTYAPDFRRQMVGQARLEQQRIHTRIAETLCFCLSEAEPGDGNQGRKAAPDMMPDVMTEFDAIGSWKCDVYDGDVGTCCGNVPQCLAGILGQIHTKPACREINRVHLTRIRIVIDEQYVQRTRETLVGLRRICGVSRRDLLGTVGLAAVYTLRPLRRTGAP